MHHPPEIKREVNLELPDFDTLCDLHTNNPEALEKLRKQLIDEAIDNTAPDFQRRLRGIQFQIDSHLQLRSNSVSRCIYISQLMNDSAAELLDRMNDLATLTLPPSPPQVTNICQHQASILPFKKEDQKG